MCFRTFYCKRFPNCECFTVRIYGDLVVQQSFVHDECVQFLWVSPVNTAQRKPLNSTQVQLWQKGSLAFLPHEITTNCCSRQKLWGFSNSFQILLMDYGFSFVVVTNATRVHNKKKSHPLAMKHSSLQTALWNSHEKLTSHPPETRTRTNPHLERQTGRKMTLRLIISAFVPVSLLCLFC